MKILNDFKELKKMELIIATSNKNKLKEIKEIFLNFKNLTIYPMDKLGEIPEIIEDGITFKDNALIKARTIANLCNCAVLADDSGLEVKALKGRPGVHSARYGGNGLTDTDRNDLLLKELEDIPKDARECRFVCSMVLILPNGETFSTEGYCEGIVSNKIHGKNGFGYDPVFYLPNYKKSMAEISSAEKNKISHRGNALQQIKSIMIKNSII